MILYSEIIFTHLFDYNSLFYIVMGEKILFIDLFKVFTFGKIKNSPMLIHVSVCVSAYFLIY